MFEERLGSFQRDIFARMAVLVVGVGLCFYGFLIKKSIFGLYFVPALQNSFQMVADLDRNSLKII